MHGKLGLAAMVLGLLCGCGPDTGGVATSGPTTQQRIEQHLKDAGESLKAAATEAGAELKPAIDKAKEQTQDALHRAAVKVSEMTAPTSASQPASRP